MFGQASSFAALTVESSTEGCSPRELIKEYLVMHEPEFARLHELQEEVLYNSQSSTAER